MKRVRQLFLIVSLVFGLALATLIASAPSFSAKRDNSAMAQAAAAAELRDLHKRPTFAVTVLDKAAHNAFPAAAKLADGTLMVIYRLALYHYNPNGPNPTSMAKAYSFDGGQTWTAPEELKMPSLPGVGAAGLSVPQYGPLAGKPIAVFETTGRDGHRRTAISVANDPAGFTWGQPYTPAYNPWNTIGLPSSPAEQISDNEFAITAYATNYDTASTVVRWTGSGWTTVRYASISGRGNPESYSEGSMALIEDANGKTSLMAVLRQEVATSGNLKISKSYSHDNGQTWSKPTPAFDGYGLPYIVSLGANTVMVSYRKLHAPDESAKQWPRDAVYRISTDNGKTWGPETLYGATDRQMAYGVLIPYEANTVIGVYGKEDGHRKSAIRASTILLNLPNASPTAYSLAAKVGPGGTVVPSTAVKVNAGGNQTFRIVPDAGFSVASVTVNGKVVPAPDNILSVSNVQANQDIVVAFAAKAPAPAPSASQTASETSPSPSASSTGTPSATTTAKPSMAPSASPSPAVIPSATPTPTPEKTKPKTLAIQTRISAAGTKATVTASGFIPGDQIQGFVEPSVRTLGKQSADPNGFVSFTFDAAGLKAGDHQVVLAGSQGGTGIVEFVISNSPNSKPPVPINRPQKLPETKPVAKKKETPAPAPVAKATPTAKPTTATTGISTPVTPSLVAPSTTPTAPPTAVVPAKSDGFRVARTDVPQAAALSHPRISAGSGIVYGYGALLVGLAGAILGGTMLLRRNKE